MRSMIVVAAMAAVAAALAGCSSEEGLMGPAAIEAPASQVLLPVDRQETPGDAGTLQYTEGLLLISDYRKEQKPLWVERSRKYTGPVTLCDAFSGQEVAKLSAGQWEFEIDLKKSAVRLLMWKKTTTK